LIPLPDIDAPESRGAGRAREAAGFELDDRSTLGRIAAPARRRSLFEEDFDQPPRPATPAEPEIITPTFSLEEYEAARAEAWRAGQAAEREAALSADSAATRNALAAIATQIEMTRVDATRVAEDAAEAVASLLLDTLGALFPVLCARFGTAEAEGVLRAILPALRVEPRATIRLAPKLARRIADTLAQADPDLPDRVDIIADEAVPDGDIRVTWRNGEARRDAAALWAEIGDILGQAGWPTTHARMMETIDGQ
jgi:hypothetical protein